MKVECQICGKEYQARRKIDHIKRSHRIPAYDHFILQYIDKSNKVCRICKNNKPFKTDAKQHVSRIHLGRAVKEFAQTF
jgi:hypothetical protein